MPRLSFFQRENLSEEENRRWMIYWAVYGVTIFVIFFSFDKSGIGFSIWEKLAIAFGVLLVFGLVYYIDSKRRKKKQNP